jgi:hypothetical protein
MRISLCPAFAITRAISTPASRGIASSDDIVRSTGISAGKALCPELLLFAWF